MPFCRLLRFLPGRSPTRVRPSLREGHDDSHRLSPSNRCEPRSRMSAAAIARCSAPWSASVRPRRSKTMRPTVTATPAISERRCGRNANRSGAATATASSNRSRGLATPPRRKSGDTESPRRTSPRTSGTFPRRSRGAGIAPSRSVPSTPAKAQKRSLTIATPSGLAMPPSRGRACAPSKLTSTDSTYPSLPGLRPPGNGPGGLDHEVTGLPPAAREEAEQREHENDDQDDPENAQGSHLLRASFPNNRFLTTEGALNLAAFFPPRRRARTRDAKGDLDGLDQLRPRQRGGAPVRRDLRAQVAPPPRPRARPEPDRLPGGLQARGQARPGRRGGQGLRVRARRVRLDGGRGLRGSARRGISDDRDHRLRPLRAGRPDLLRAHVLPRARAGRREGLQPLAACARGFRAGRDLEVRDARPPVFWRAPRPRRRDHARAAGLARRKP